MNSKGGRRVISTDAAPVAIGPYSQAIRSGDFVFVSGQIPIEPATGHLISDLSIASQARQCLNNLSGILSAAGSSLGQAVKITIYLTDMGSFTEVNGVYGEFFSGEPPARATVGVAALPMGVSVEMDCIAVTGG